MDEPESTAALALAGREGLDNLTFVINCNLQRLDGPVRPNFKIVQELEAQFRAAGWNVVKSLWGQAWDEVFALDTDGALLRRLRETPDAQFQTYATRDAAYLREHFFGANESLQAIGRTLSDAKLLELFQTSRAGHEPRKVYAAYKAAVEHKGAPTVILAQTVKGYTLGAGFESRNANHQMKKLTGQEFRTMRDLLELPIPDSALEGDLVPYWRPADDSPEMTYLRERRAALGGPAPARKVVAKPLPMPADKNFDALKKGSGSQEIATTMAFVRLVKDLMRDKETGKRWVPIVPDEARTFGMESLFPTAGLYSPKGSTYDPVDRDQLLWYKEAKDGQILNEGITEAGSLADFTAAATSYATHGEPMIPFYIFYSMFGWQRTADQFWALADQLGRGFVIGATAGRTTMTGEGLQHADGHSHLIASTNPAALSYDPAFAYEVSVIVKEGLRRMYGGADGGRGRLLLPDGLQRDQGPAGHAAGRRRGHPQGPVPLPGGRASPPPTARSSSCWPPAPPSTGSWRPSSCWPPTGAWRRTSGRRRPGRSCAATRWSATPPGSTARTGSRTSPVRWPAPPARSSRSATGCGRCPTRSPRGSSRTGSPSAPTASASPTPVTRPAGTSASTRSRSSCRRSPRSPAAARSSRRPSRRPRSATACETWAAPADTGSRPPQLPCGDHPPRPGSSHGNPPVRPGSRPSAWPDRAHQLRPDRRRSRLPVRPRMMASCALPG